MLSFKSFSSAAVTLAGIEMVYMMRKRQGRFAFNPAPTLKEQLRQSPLKCVQREAAPRLLENLQHNPMEC